MEALAPVRKGGVYIIIYSLEFPIPKAAGFWIALGYFVMERTRGGSMLYILKRTMIVRYIRGLFFDGSTVKRAEPDTWQFIYDNVRCGWKCVDVGANRGEFSILMARRAGKTGYVWAFELHPANANSLRSNLWRYRRCLRVENMAVTDGKTELVEVFPGRNRSSAEWNIVGQDMTGEKKQPEFCVKATSLDNYFPSGERIDLVKIDVEGAAAQVKVIRGMQRILEKSRPLLVMEIHNDDEWKAVKGLEFEEYTVFDLKGARLGYPGDLVSHLQRCQMGSQSSLSAAQKHRHR